MVLLRRSSWLASLASTLSLVRAAANPPFLPQSFFFDWTPEGEPVPIPVTRQCEVINIRWGRGLATGPNPRAPYFLQVYTSTFVFPFVIAAGEGLAFDWPVPFAPGTQYQICMFDSEGNAGGCQASYTVIPSNSRPSCVNVTFPQGPLDVEGIVEDGVLSQFGWINQCTDISITPKNGTPPYTFTIAPSLHPPINITANDMMTMNWTVELSWASQFFISVSDSLGNSWSQGPLHSGGHGPTNCLALGANADESKVAPAIAIAGSVGGLAAGLLIGGAATYLFIRREDKRDKHKLMEFRLGTGPLASGSSSTRFGNYSAVPLNDTLVATSPISGPLAPNRRPEYHVEPFILPSDHRGRQTMIATQQDAAVHRTTSLAASVMHPHSFATSGLGLEPQHESSQVPPLPPPPSSSGPVSPANTVAPTLPAVQQQRPPQSQVYVIHHDAGRAPVTVYHSDGTEVVELPPQYIAGSRPPPSSGIGEGGSRSISRGSGSDQVSDGQRAEYTSPVGATTTPFFQQERRPTSIRKNHGSASTSSVRNVSSREEMPSSGQQRSQEQGQPRRLSVYNPSEPSQDWGAR